MILRLLPLLFFFAACSSPDSPTTLDTEQETVAINKLLDGFHHAAAVADEDTFFGSISSDGIYLGTDQTERWDKATFMDWSLKYFQKESAWDFTSHDRHIDFSEDGHTAWFDELLDTWMGTCRGSGVLSYKDGQWLIEQYNLAMTIDNDDVDAVLDVIKVGSPSI